MWFIGVEVEQETSAPPPKKNPRSAPEKPHVDTVTTNKWLSSNLKGETEGLLVAAQDQAINTRNYQKVICGQQVESK